MMFNISSSVIQDLESMKVLRFKFISNISFLKQKQSWTWQQMIGIAACIFCCLVLQKKVMVQICTKCDSTGLANFLWTADILDACILAMLMDYQSKFDHLLVLSIQIWQFVVTNSKKLTNNWSNSLTSMKILTPSHTGKFCTETHRSMSSSNHNLKH